jgi:hypothetical protein
MKELIVQHAGRPYRILYAFDPRRSAILLIGGDKTGKNRWYEEFVPVADELYDEHLELLRKEGLIARYFADGHRANQAVRRSPKAKEGQLRRQRTG